MPVKYFRSEKEVTQRSKNRRPHLRLIVILAIDTGLRMKELLSLKRSHIDLDKKVITIPARPTKALKERTIVLSPRAENELRDYFAKIAFHPNALLFFGLKSVGRSFETACRFAGIKGLNFHDLRHTATTWMDEAGISTAVKQNMIGHSDERTHQKYHNLSSDVIEATRAKMERFEQDRLQIQSRLSRKN